MARGIGSTLELRAPGGPGARSRDGAGGVADLHAGTAQYRSMVSRRLAGAGQPPAARQPLDLLWGLRERGGRHPAGCHPVHPRRLRPSQLAAGQARPRWGRHLRVGRRRWFQLQGARSLRGKGLHAPALHGVTWPGSSPYLTSVGGTRLALTSANQRSDEVVWNDLRWLGPSEGGGAGGGGLSLFSPRPPFQTGLGLPGDILLPCPTCPPLLRAFPAGPWSWAGPGALTAAPAPPPLVASAMAVISANLRRHHLPPIGPADGLFYYLARTQPSTLWDVIHGSNGFYPSIPADYAKRGYDLASGLGRPAVRPDRAGTPFTRPTAGTRHRLGVNKLTDRQSAPRVEVAHGPSGAGRHGSFRRRQGSLAAVRSSC